MCSCRRSSSIQSNPPNEVNLRPDRRSSSIQSNPPNEVNLRPEDLARIFRVVSTGRKPAWPSARTDSMSMSQLRAMAGPEPSLILEACSPFHVVFANPAWCALSGYSKDEIVGNSVSQLHGPLTCVETVNALEVAMSGV